MIKILEAFGEPISYGGQESFVMNVLDHMDGTDMSIDLLTPYYCDNRNASEKVRTFGGKVYAFDMAFRPGKIRHAVEGPIKRFLRSRHYDVIHIHSGSSSMLEIYARLAFRAGIPGIIVHSHSTGVNDWKHRASRLATSYGLSRYPSQHCACSYEAGEWRFPENVCKNSLCLITDGIDADGFRFDPGMRERVRAKLGVTDDEVLIGNAGRLAYQKNQIFLIDLLARIRSMPGGSRYRLILAGAGEDEAKLKQRAEAVCPGDTVIFAGVCENIGDYYQAMDVFAMPSLYEGFGMAAAEAQAAGLEVIASDRIPGAVGITDHVRFIPLEDKNAWTGALTALHKRHAESADIIAASDYDIRKTAEAVRNMYLRYYEVTPAAAERQYRRDSR